MNDFTKEELFDLQSCVLFWNANSKKPFDSINEKLQLMIDKYCEHDGEIGKDYPAEKCMKCGLYWE